jgi:peptidyl-prolyl cis-trans isomerase D
MIKIVRYANEKYPWLLAGVMGFVAITFIVGMGWWGFGETSGTTVASVGDLKVSRDEFRRAYENTYRLYKDRLQGEVKDELIKQFVLEQLIENRLWLLAAKDLGLTVSAEDLRADITGRSEFQRNGQFDPDLYRRLLAANRLTPAAFEAVEAQDLLTNKARMIIRDSVALTPTEVAEAQALVARQATLAQPSSSQAQERIYQDVLFQKQQRALAAYAEALKTRTPIKIHRELL